MDTPNRYFNGWRWQGWKPAYGEEDVQPCLDYFEKIFTALTDHEQGAYCNVFRLHLDPCWTNNPNLPLVGDGGEHNISQFSRPRLITYWKSLYIEIIKKEVTEIPTDGISIIATGPLTSNDLFDKISNIIGNNELHFYDAAAPIVQKDSIDMNIAFYGDRYSQEKKKDETLDEWKIRTENEEKNYINLPMNKDEYENFWNELVSADVVELHSFEKQEIFEGCMPVEVMAKRGVDTLRFGPLKPVGFDDPRTGRRPYAIVQLRQDNFAASLYNIVGFQTNLKYGEQKRVFSMIPGLMNVEFVKYGVMHRNTFINSTKVLNNNYQLRNNENIFFAGQITGVEGYVESIASGLIAGINAVKFANNDKKFVLPKETMIGALTEYISTDNEKFQPMNANFGILPELPTRVRDKKERYQMLADRSLKLITTEKI